MNINLKPLSMKSIMIMFVLLGDIFFIDAVRAQDSSKSVTLQDLELSSLNGEVKVYFSEGFTDRAVYLQELVEAASRFFQKPEIIGVKVDLHLAVLGPKDWAKFTKLPYGIAHILPEPPTAILAASAENVIANGILAEKDRMSEVTLKHLDELNISFNEAAATFTDLIAFHEMGHIYAHHHGSEPWPEQKWLSEFVATYLAYAYMIENQPELAELWETLFEPLAVNLGEKHTTLSDFESLYLGVGGENYRWYQARFFQKVKEVYSKSGITFVHTLKKSLADNPEASKDDPFRLIEMDAISEGFSTWAKGTDGDLD